MSLRQQFASRDSSSEQLYSQPLLVHQDVEHTSSNSNINKQQSISVSDDTDVQYLDLEQSVPMDDDHGDGTAGIPSSMINILNTIMGAGLLAMPNAITTLGIGLAVIVIMLSGSAAAFGLYLLARCAALVGRSASFNSVSKITYPQAAVFFDIAVAIKCFGVGVSYLVIIGDLAPSVLHDFNVFPEGHVLLTRQMWITIFMAVITPLCFLKRLDSLKYTSFVALGGILYLMVLIVYMFFNGTQSHIPVENIEIFAPKLTFLKALPVFVFAFTCHQNLFSVHNELRNNSLKRLNFVIVSCIGISMVSYIAFGIFGYLMFGNDAAGNIIINFQKSWPVTIGRIAYAILMLFSYPLQLHPCRASLDKIISRAADAYRSVPQQDPSTAEQQQQYQGSVSLSPASAQDVSTVKGKHFSVFSNFSSVTAITKKMNNTKFICMTLVILLLSYIIAFFVSDLSLVLGYVGATGSTTICYILPSLFYLKATEGKSWTMTRVFAMILLITGCIVMPVCIVSLIVNQASG
ncbi:hypothetical protein MIR68_009044 [Amoeboaphelidium protococcarum]|nr:hypothetical protein MIR68_009044 [Amoeboaphelidium protococcarum]